MRLVRWMLPLLCIAAALVGCGTEATSTLPTPLPTELQDANLSLTATNLLGYTLQPPPSTPPAPISTLDPVFQTVTAIYAPDESTRPTATFGTLDPIAMTATWIVGAVTHNASGQATWTLAPTRTLDPRTLTETLEPDLEYLLTNITQWAPDAEQNITTTPPAPVTLYPVEMTATYIVQEATRMPPMTFVGGGLPVATDTPAAQPTSTPAAVGTLDAIMRESTRIVAQATSEIETIEAQWTPDNLEPRERWRIRGSEDYRMTIVSVALPQPPVGRDITVQNGVISENSIIACENPSEDYPERLCAPITAYYQWVGNHTVEDLFEITDGCVERTLASFADCPVISPKELGTSYTYDEMYDAARACEATLDSSDHLCSIEYHPYYGYPRMIVFFTPDVSDGSGTITIRHFEITP